MNIKPEKAKSFRLNYRDIAAIVVSLGPGVILNRQRESAMGFEFKGRLVICEKIWRTDALVFIGIGLEYHQPSAVEFVTEHKRL